MYIIGYCKECGKVITNEHEIPDHKDIYECGNCGHPQTKDEMYESF